MNLTAFDLAQRYIGIRELTGAATHPLIAWWHSLCNDRYDTPDSVPWCSAFVNGVAWELRLPRSKSAAARSWLGVGRGIVLAEAQVGFDLVVLMRGDGQQPGPEVLAAPGHVGFYAGIGTNGSVLVLGGNQGDAVSVATFSPTRILGIRRLA